MPVRKASRMEIRWCFLPDDSPQRVKLTLKLYPRADGSTYPAGQLGFWRAVPDEGVRNHVYPRSAASSIFWKSTFSR